MPSCRGRFPGFASCTSKAYRVTGTVAFKVTEPLDPRRTVSGFRLKGGPDDRAEALLNSSHNVLVSRLYDVLKSVEIIWKCRLSDRFLTSTEKANNSCFSLRPIAG